MKKFNKLIGQIAGKDTDAVISFIRSQGINISQDASPSQVVAVIYKATASRKFSNNLKDWILDRYFQDQEKSFNAYSKASGNFDPMNAQSGGAELNLSGVDSFPSDSPFNDDFGIPDYGGGSTSGSSSSSSSGGFLDSIGGSAGQIINTGLGFLFGSIQSKKDREMLEAQTEAEKAKLDAQVKLGNISLEQAKIQLQQIEAQAKAQQGKTPVVLYVVGGVVLLGAIGTAIYFATRK